MDERKSNAEPSVRQDQHASPSPLFSDRAFWGMTTTQFLGAFNDNLFKQLVLLMAVGGAVVTSAADAGNAPNPAADRQPLALVLFSLPFILFSGIAGFLSERYSKRTVIVACKVAEIGIVLLGMAGFALWHVTELYGLLFVLFLMGTHSAFFGPGKYGVLTELFAEHHLPQVNGIILMTTFLAIIFGTALAGGLKDWLGNDRLWLASAVCVVVALAGTQTALMVRRVPPANPSLQFTGSALFIPTEIWQLLRRDRDLVKAMLASSLFWLIGGLVQPTVNSLGKAQFDVSDTKTSILAACMGVGIAIGCLLAGKLSQGRVRFGLMRSGAWIIVAMLVLLAIPGSPPMNLLDYNGSAAALVVLGLGAGLFAVPVQVFLQSRPPAALKGRTIATMNLANWIAIFTAAGLYKLFDSLLTSMAWPRAAGFAFTALLMLPVAVLYRPRDEALA